MIKRISSNDDKHLISNVNKPTFKSLTSSLKNSCAINIDIFKKESNLKELNDFLSKISKYKLFFEFTKSLTEGSSWGGMNSVGFNYTPKWKICSVAICSMDKELGEYTVKNVSIKDFLKAVKKVRNELIENSPEQKQEYFNTFKKLKDKIDKCSK